MCLGGSVFRTPADETKKTSGVMAVSRSLKAPYSSCKCVCTCMCECICMCMCVYMCTCVHVSVHDNASVRVYMHVCMCVYHRSQGQTPAGELFLLEVLAAPDPRIWWWWW